MARKLGLFAAGAIVCVFHWGCGSGATAPDAGGRRYVGTWSGSITSEAVGQGALTLTIQSQTDTPTASLISGSATRTFTDSRFSGTVAVSGSALPGGGIGLTFDRATVPCPLEAGGEASRTLIATLTVSGDTMQGTYVAGGCPGGTLQLQKK